MKHMSRKKFIMKSNYQKDIIERLKKAYSGATDQALATIFGVEKAGTISNYRCGRRKIPLEYIVQAVNDTGKSFEWVMTGKEVVTIPPNYPQLEEILDAAHKTNLVLLRF